MGVRKCTSLYVGSATGSGGEQHGGSDVARFRALTDELCWVR